MATITSVVTHWLNTLYHSHLSADKLLFTVDDPDGYSIPTEKSSEEVLHLLRDNKSLWKIKDNWSDEAIELRELLATCTIKKFNDEVFYFFLKSLRIVDKQITAVDSTVTKFSRLEDLVLSGNRISDVSPNILPQSLVFLELNSNSISFKDPHGTALAKGLPHLKHLGLGRNSIDNLSWFIPQLWSNLASLDLSYNNLSNFDEVMEKIIRLPYLKSLVLVGNPLSLAAAYRTGIVQRLGHLHTVDDIPIAADETLNANPIATAVSTGKLDWMYTHAQLQMRVSSPLQGLPQPPINEITQSPPDWFFRVELLVPASLFDSGGVDNATFLSTVFNQPVNESVAEVAVPGVAQKGGKEKAATERLNPVIERDVTNATIRICSPGLKYHQNMVLGTLFQPIINTSALEQLRDCLQTSSVRVAVVLLIRTVVTPESSRPSSSNKKEKQGKDHDKETKDQKAAQGAKNRRATQAPADLGSTATILLERVVLGEGSFATAPLVYGSISPLIVKINVPSSTVLSIVEQTEKSRPPSVSRGRKRGETKSPTRGDRKSPKGERKSPRPDKTPPAGASKPGAKATGPATTGAPVGGGPVTQSEVAVPPPPDLQASFSFELTRIKLVQDVNKWASVASNTASVMVVPTSAAQD